MVGDEGAAEPTDDFLIEQLENGPLHRFSDYAMLGGVIPSSGAGV